MHISYFNPVLRISAFGAILALGTLSASASLAISGNNRPAIEIQSPASSGLDAVYVVYDMSAATVSYTAQSQTVTWYRYGSRGGGFAEEVTGISRQGNVYSVKPGADDLGYIIDDGTRRTCYWLVNYENHRLELSSLTVDAVNSDCSTTILSAVGKGGAITYYSVNGRGIELNREMSLTYRTLTYDESQAAWAQGETAQVVSHLSEHITVPAPLCDTDFRLEGDRFLRQWDESQEISTDLYRAIAVSAVTTADQQQRDVDNESRPEVSSLGGSAPCVITFSASPTDAAVFREWQFSNTESFEDVLDRFSQDVLEYSFADQGTMYVRYVCGNAEGTCFYEGDVYSVMVGESKLEIPNAFSPINQDGVNDVWKVSYTSIVSFECHIFNRWGTKICTLTSPSQGWDGKYNGKIVQPGVYFYVIKAVGADGVKYNKSGDINILGSRHKAGGDTSVE